MINTPRACVRRKKSNDCYGCTDRYVGCHGECEKYAAYKNAIRDEYWKMRNAYDGERMAEHYSVGGAAKNAERKGKPVKYCG